MTSTTREKMVSIDDSMPPRYAFVPKGNSYRTLNCRKQTHDEGETVYIVQNAKNEQIGIRVPYAILMGVIEQEQATKESRAQVVEKRDAKMAANFQNAMVSVFPQIPAELLPTIVKHTMRKHSGRVGRTGTLDMSEKALLAVRAHIRHTLTDYDKLLKGGMSKELARDQVNEKIDGVALKWGWTPKQKHPAEVKGASKNATRKSKPDRRRAKASMRPSLKDKKLMKRRANTAASTASKKETIAKNTAGASRA